MKLTRNMSRRAKITAGIGGLVLVLGVAGAGTALAVGGDGNGDTVTGPAAGHARSAAAAAVPGGRAGEVRAGSDAGAAYGVQVTRPDGSAVEVNLDRGFAVLGTQPVGQDGTGDGADGADGDGG